MKRFRFADYEPVQAFRKTTVEVEANSLEEAKKKLLNYYWNEGDGYFNNCNEYGISVMDSQLVPRGHNLGGYAVCLEDFSETDNGNFVLKK